MARKSRTKALVTIPGKWDPYFVEKLDSRFNVATAVRERIGCVESDLGGRDGLAYSRRCLVRKMIWMEAVSETFEQRFAAGEAVDMGQWTQTVNTLLGLLRSVGFERKPQRAVTLRSKMNGHEPAVRPPAVSQPASAIAPPLDGAPATGPQGNGPSRPDV